MNDPKTIGKNDDVCMNCGSDMCICEPTSCLECDDGTIVDCMDDLCHIGDGCIHGDGNKICTFCDGEGNLYPTRGTEKQYNQRLREGGKE